jgi:phosphatidylinositol glycan class Z
MWRRTQLWLILVRLYFALSPSYLHPDENFQGPEVIAGTLIYVVRIGQRSFSRSAEERHGMC